MKACAWHSCACSFFKEECVDLFDPVFLSRAQFGFAALIHYIFVPLSVGLGLFMAIFITRAKRSGYVEHVRQASFLVKLFALVFICSVATGIALQFSLGANWADFSRYVGGVFGVPLIAAVLFAFFLQSIFMGILIFGAGKVSKTFYTVSAWFVWCGSLLSAFCVLIANSWMQTPSGYVVDALTKKAQLTDFFAAVFNPESLPTFLHTVLALIIMGSFVLIAISCFYKLRNAHEDFSRYAMRAGSIVAFIAVVLMIPVSQMQTSVVADYQPSKFAAMQGQYETKSTDATLFGFVDTQNKEVVGPSIPGLASSFASGDASKEYLGLDDIESAAPGSTPSANIVQVTFVSYHFMIVMMVIIALGLICALIVAFKRSSRAPRFLLYFLRWAWVAPLIAVITGWLTREFGRQPWIVYGQLKTAESYSQAVSTPQIIITLLLFIIVYAIIVTSFVRMFKKFVNEGPKKSVDPSGQNTPIAHVSKRQAQKNIAAVQENDARLRQELSLGKNRAVQNKAESESENSVAQYENAGVEEDVIDTEGVAAGMGGAHIDEEPAVVLDDAEQEGVVLQDDEFDEDDPDNPYIPDEEKVAMKAAAKELELKPSEEHLADKAQAALDNVEVAKANQQKAQSMAQEQPEDADTYEDSDYYEDEDEEIASYEDYESADEEDEDYGDYEDIENEDDEENAFYEDEEDEDNYNDDDNEQDNDQEMRG